MLRFSGKPPGRSAPKINSSDADLVSQTHERPRGSSENRYTSGVWEVPRVPTHPPARDDRLIRCCRKRERTRARGRERILILSVVSTRAVQRAVLPLGTTGSSVYRSGPQASPLASRRSPPASRLPSPVSHLSPLASRLPSPVSRLSPPVSRLSPLASRLPSPVSRLSPLAYLFVTPDTLSCDVWSTAEFESMGSSPGGRVHSNLPVRDFI
jgi:hypothetical protein